MRKVVGPLSIVPPLASANKANWRSLPPTPSVNSDASAYPTLLRNLVAANEKTGTH